MASWAVMKASGIPPGLDQVEGIGDPGAVRRLGDEVLGLASSGDDAHHPVARTRRGHVGPDGLHDAGELQARDVGRRSRRGGVAARPLEEVGPVDAGPGDPDEHLTGRRFGDGAVLDDEAAAF